MADREPQTPNPQLNEAAKPELSRRKFLQGLLSSIGAGTLAGCTGDQFSSGSERQAQQTTKDIRVWMKRTGSAVLPTKAILIVQEDNTPAVQDPNSPADDGSSPMNYGLNTGDMVEVLDPHPGLGSNYVNGYVRVVSNGENGWVNIKNLEFKDER